ncbi:hypothetical protein KUCAC02_018443 [Chaenocephalus aceratus]|uniref:Uncharacterized protein n=1 Tax=Chaenocephalus aceratus TaxID=36190 RepID=A0ACB9W9X0_CHAAC|nr:hypothetical protein KUCAC02_018443 [Chaenocephalus aceratus]
MRILRPFLQKGVHMLQCFCGQRSKSTTITNEQPLLPSPFSPAAFPGAIDEPDTGLAYLGSGTSSGISERFHS